MAKEREDVWRNVGTNLWFQSVYLSTPPPSGATMDDIEDAKLPEFYKFWTLIGDLAHDPKRGADATRRLRAKGCSVWCYHCGLHMHARSSLKYYRHAPRKAYADGLDGSAMWCSSNSYGDDSFDPSDGSDDGILWYGNDRRFVSSKNFEAFREGLEDVAYMDALVKAVNGRDVRSSNGRAGSPLPAAIARAQSLLDARADVMKSHDQKALDAWRLAAGRAIDALSR
jgi:hypothetical protein